MRVECDADTRKIAERHVWRALRRLAYGDGNVRGALDDVVVALDPIPFEPCGWTGDVEDPVAWTCPACLTEHVTPEPDGERDVSPADAAYYADRAADQYEQWLYGEA